ncbi:DUF4402 domain-containing protein [Chitinophaga deserti]|uniref:DUF4402 domain-containing protein n=1 Tax=Chitinophaga deserti TaxID=2164099 RepID=UPI000D6CABC1|nr:DUF4402 domain-containing protein [Chitinophaga deserti]
MKSRYGYLKWIAALALLSATTAVLGQEQPPRPIAVHVDPGQGLIFGAFFSGPSGGTVTIFPDGTRTVMGTVVGANMGYPFAPAIFEVEANPGTIIHIIRGPAVVLNGSNGGSMTMTIGQFSTSDTFVTTATPPTRNLVRVGGILTVGSPPSNPVGAYNGTFSLTFIQE